MIDELNLVYSKLNDINYGFVDNNKNIYPDNLKDWNNKFCDLYHLQSPEELIKTKYGVCWDQVELERYYLDERNIKSKTYFIIAKDNKQEPTHTFLVVHLDKYYWLEHSWDSYKGIHVYQSLDELLNDVQLKFEKSIEKENVKDYEINIYEYEKPKFNIGCIEFMNYCERGKKIS